MATHIQNLTDSQTLMGSRLLKVSHDILQMQLVDFCKRLILKYLAFTLVFPAFMLSRNLSAQVINDDIENRIALSIDSAPFTSNTSDCTVQWSCVDQSLTGKCIQYHNDQWFFFNAGAEEKLYINIANQNCRDDQGVQIVVLQGIACKPSTYKIRTCVSLANQDDIFVRLDSLTSGEPYLINVDGYLNDYCKFQIDVSNKPKGIPVQPSHYEMNFKMKAEENLVKIAWTHSEEIGDEIFSYEIYRRKSGKHTSVLIATIATERNSYGTTRSDYSYQDTLKQNGTYDYKLVALSNREDSYLLGERQVIIQQDGLSNSWISMQLDFEDNASLRALLLDRLTQSILLRKDFSFKKENDLFDLFIEPYVKSGVTTFEVVVVDLNTGERKVYFFDK